MKEIILDTETTGLSVSDGHRIVEIGCIELEDQIPTKNRFHCYLNPERKVSEKAREVHGYTDEFLSDKKKFKDIVDDFLSFINNKKIIIHNAEFDLSHINNELSILGRPKLSKENILEPIYGPKGGYRLNPNYEKFTLIEFIEILEGPFGIAGCLKDENCDQLLNCNIII